MEGLAIVSPATEPFARVPSRLAPPDEPGEQGVAGLWFDYDAYRRLSVVRDVDLEATDRRTGGRYRSPVWIVGVSGCVFIRSRRGAGRQWFRDLQVDPWLALHLDGERIPASVALVTDPRRVDAVTTAFLSKYASDASLARVLHARALGATLEVHPSIV